mgnify:FL=1
MGMCPKETGDDDYYCFFLPYQYLALRELTDNSKYVWTITSIKRRIDQVPYRTR